MLRVVRHLDAGRGPSRWQRALGRCGWPLLLLAGGAASWHAGTPPPGAPAVVQDFEAQAVMLTRQGTLYARGADALWHISRAGTPRRLTATAALWSGCPPEMTAFVPLAAVVSARGDLFVTDALGRRVVRVDRRGRISPVAGTGRDGPAGDGGPATSAGLHDVENVALDKEGNLYLEEAGTGRVRRVDRRGIITTVVHGGAQSPAAALAAPHCWQWSVTDRAGNTYVCDGGLRRIDTSASISPVVTDRRRLLRGLP